MSRPLRNAPCALLLILCTSCNAGDDVPSSSADLPQDAAAEPSGGDAGSDARPRGKADCDLLGQDCAQSSDKCTIVESQGPLASACISRRGEAQENEPCTRGAAGFGDDDCAPGLFCSFIGELGPAQGGVRRCHPLCTEDHDCPQNQRCGILIDAPDKGGFCGPACEPFSPCGERLTCGDLYAGAGGDADPWLSCRPIGTHLSGDPCNNAYQCPANHVCGDNGTCQALCDASHPCALGTCHTLGKAGVCL
jgi:hypothetical protein